MARRSDGLYARRGYWYFKFKTPDGVWREQATRTQNYADARKIRSDFLADLEQGKLPNERARWTLRQAIEQRLVDRKYRLATGSFASEAAIARTLLRVLGADVRLHRLADIENIRHYETVRLAQGISPKTVNNEIVVLAGVLREAKLWRRVEEDYKRLAVRKSDIPDALTREEAYRLIQLARVAGEDAVAPLAAVLAYATGMRSCEIKQLQIGAIHLEPGHPQIQVKRETTKTNKGARFVALD
ncbi:MAG: hypothetical protein LAO03_16425 [Acidobacteriia bacterium]|nr:hypothetical protein [Terriglobia bacterium]